MTGWDGKKRHPSVKAHEKFCDVYKKWRSEVNTKNGRRGYEAIVERGEIEQWKEKIGERVSQAILSDPKEIERRRELSKTTITKWATSEEGRQKSSETAKITSIRPEIQAARSERLKKWRDEHPEEFSAIIEKMHNSFCSKPQKDLFKTCAEIDSKFKHNQQIVNHQFTNKTHRRQIDVLHPENKIVVEFDGPYHFFGLKNSPLEEVQKRDIELNDVLVSSGYTVIRCTYDDYKKGSFSDRVVNAIRDAVDGKITGLHQIGDAYAEDR